MTDDKVQEQLFFSFTFDKMQEDEEAKLSRGSGSTQIFESLMNDTVQLFIRFTLITRSIHICFP